MNTNWFTVEQVDPYVYAIAEFYHFEKVVSYLVVGNTQAILIDTGMGFAPIAPIIRMITRVPVRVYLTHTHWDHIGGVDEFEKIFVYNEKKEIRRLQRGFDSTEISELQDVDLFQKPFTPKSYIVGGGNHDVFNDKEIIRCDPWTFEILHTPGHTPGSVCFLEQSQGWLFTGDTLYPGPLYAFEKESNIQLYSGSIRYILKYIDSIRYIFPGHNKTRCAPEIVSESAGVFVRILRGESPDSTSGGIAQFFGTTMSILCSQIAYRIT